MQYDSTGPQLSFHTMYYIMVPTLKAGISTVRIPPGQDFYFPANSGIVLSVHNRFCRIVKISRGQLLFWHGEIMRNNAMYACAKASLPGSSQ